MKGYPTVKYWNYGFEKKDHESIDYKGGRTSGEIRQFVEKLVLTSDIQPEVHELTANRVY